MRGELSRNGWYSKSENEIDDLNQLANREDGAYGGELPCGGFGEGYRAAVSAATG